MPPRPSIRVLIIDDDKADTQKAITIFLKLGLEVQSKITVWAARSLLEEIAEGERPPPHLMVLDLGFPNESGFEVLRYWKSTAKLANIPIVVWTQAGDAERKMAAFFGVSAVVEKSDGLEELEKELKRVINSLT